MHPEPVGRALLQAPIGSDLGLQKVSIGMCLRNGFSPVLQKHKGEHKLCLEEEHVQMFAHQLAGLEWQGVPPRTCLQSIDQWPSEGHSAHDQL